MCIRDRSQSSVTVGRSRDQCSSRSIRSSPAWPATTSRLTWPRPVLMCTWPSSNGMDLLVKSVGILALANPSQMPIVEIISAITVATAPPASHAALTAGS